MTARTVTLPINPGASWDDFAWDPKYSTDDLDFTLDCADWLADAGRAIESVALAATPGLVVGQPSLTGPGNAIAIISVQISAGSPGTIAQVQFTLTLDDGGALNVLVALPIRAALPGLQPVVPDVDLVNAAILVAVL